MNWVAILENKKPTSPIYGSNLLRHTGVHAIQDTETQTARQTALHTSNHDFSRLLVTTAGNTKPLWSSIRPRSADTSVVYRQAEAAEDGSSVATYNGCDEKQNALIRSGVKEAQDLASRALKALKRDIPLSYERRALQDNFGKLSGGQKDTVISRYEHILNSLESTTIACATLAKKKKQTTSHKQVVGLCGKGECPGKKIWIHANYGSVGCGTGRTILHEVAHNAGACSDFDRGKNYPPKNAVDNAYSYENFAVDVEKGHEPPKLKFREPKEIVPAFLQ